MASRDENLLRPELLSIWKDILNIWHELYPKLPQPFLTCTFRSNEEQDTLYAQGRTAPGNIVTNAKAGESPHNTSPSSAFDIAFSVGKDLDWNIHNFQMLDELIQKKYGDKITWGGAFKSLRDTPHWELKDWKHYRDQHPTQA